MTTDFTLFSGSVDTYQSVVALGDITRFEFDASAWQADNDTIISVIWHSESGSVGISDESLQDGIFSALLTFNQAGKNLISIVLNTATERKKIWLEIGVKDLKYGADDYGLCG